MQIWEQVLASKFPKSHLFLLPKHRPHARIAEKMQEVWRKQKNQQEMNGSWSGFGKARYLPEDTILMVLSLFSYYHFHQIITFRVPFWIIPFSFLKDEWKNDFFSFNLIYLAASLEIQETPAQESPWSSFPKPKISVLCTANQSCRTYASENPPVFQQWQTYSPRILVLYINQVGH